MEHSTAIRFKITFHWGFEVADLWMNDIRKATSALAPWEHKSYNMDQQDGVIAKCQIAVYNLTVGFASFPFR